MDNNKQKPAEPLILDDIDDLDKAIIRLKIQGLKITEIADRLDRDRGTISGRLNKFKVQETIKEYQKTALQILLTGQADAARELNRQVKEGEKDRDKREASKEVLKGVLSESHDLNLRGGLDVKNTSDYSKLTEDQLLKMLKEKSSEPDE